MKIVMDIVGIDSDVIVSVPDNLDREEAIECAIEEVCMIKENCIEIKEVINEKYVEYKRINNKE